MKETRAIARLGAYVASIASAATLVPSTQAAVQQGESPQHLLVRTALWADDSDLAERALVRLRAEADWESASRDVFNEFEALVREGRPLEEPAPTGEAATRAFSVTLPDGREMPVFVRLPPGYDQTKRWPALLTMHGGPPGSTEGALRGADRMLSVWDQPAADAGWILVAPAMTHVVAMGQRTENRLAYEVLTPEQARAVFSAVQRRFNVDPDRVVSTGISLGSNFSIGFAAAMPDRFAAIVPVSTEGESREHLLRNLQHVPVYALEGTQDRNIRGISGPRALGEILARFAYDVTYREFGDRAHEGFQEHYPDVLRWLSTRPRQVYPRDVLRVPHDGIMGLSRRLYWVETDTRQGLVRARVAGDNRIEVVAHWARSVTLYLHDRLVDLDRPLELSVNGVDLPSVAPGRSVPFAIEQLRQLDDPGRIYAAAVTVDVPATPASLDAGRALASSLEPVQTEGQLSFWEFYATNALVERFPGVGVRGREIVLDADLRKAVIDFGLRTPFDAAGVAIDGVAPDGPFARAGVRPGDILLAVGGEPFFAGRGGLDGLNRWLVRELTAVPRTYEIDVWRVDRIAKLSANLALGPYQSQ